MKEQRKELVSLARNGNRYLPEQKESEERTLRQLHNQRTRYNLFFEGYSLGKNGGNIDEVTETVELDGKVVEKKNDRSFIGGYRKGLEDYRQKIKGEETHKTR